MPNRLDLRNLDTGMLPNNGEHVQCTFNTTGHCALHDVEVERRKNANRKIDQLELDLKDLEDKVEAKGKHIALLFNFKAQARIAAIGLSLVFAGSFLYTHHHKKEATPILASLEARWDSDHERLVKVEGDVNGLKGNVLEVLNKLDDTNKELNTTNNNLQMLISKLPNKQ